MLQDTDISFNVLAADEFQHATHNFPIMYIVNTDDSTKSGTHWIFVYGLGKDHWECFDSFGSNKCSKTSKFKFMCNRKIFVQNLRPVQSPNSNVCGQFCLYFAHCRSKGLSFEQTCAQFGFRKRHNDNIVTSFVNGLSFDKRPIKKCQNQNCKTMKEYFKVHE